jgi:hypothetical protein
MLKQYGSANDPFCSIIITTPKTTKEKLVIIFNTNLLLASLLYKDDPVSNPVNNEAKIITKSIITPPLLMTSSNS